MNKEYPFGEDVDTLVVCHDDLHRKTVIEAFGLKARYVLWKTALMGNQYNKLIYFYTDNGSDLAWITENAMLGLPPDGVVYVV